jgi:hypothetical protein
MSTHAHFGRTAVSCSGLLVPVDLGRLITFLDDAQFALVRTDFSDDAAWQRLVDTVRAPVDFAGDGEGYEPFVDPFEDSALDGATPEQIAEGLASVFDGEERMGALMIADSASMGDPAQATVVMMALGDDGNFEGTGHGRTFRCVLAEVAAIDANLSIANMDFCEFADGAGTDGVFRGFQD